MLALLDLAELCHHVIEAPVRCHSSYESLLINLVGRQHVAFRDIAVTQVVTGNLRNAATVVATGPPLFDTDIELRPTGSATTASSV